MIISGIRRANTKLYVVEHLVRTGREVLGAYAIYHNIILASAASVDFFKYCVCMNNNFVKSYWTGVIKGQEHFLEHYYVLLFPFVKNNN